MTVPSDGWEDWTSSNVVGGRWTPDGTLWIRFGDTKSGRPKRVTHYRYSGVPRAVWDALRSAESKGSEFAKSVKGRYGYDGPF